MTTVPKRASLRDMLTLNAYWVGLSFMWNSLHPIILPAVLLNFVPEAHKNTYLGLLTFAGLVIAMVLQPISGAVSDRWQSRWGRRRPLMLIGTLVDFVFLAVLAWAAGLVGLVIGYIGLQVSSNTAHGPLQGLLPDRVPPDQLGAASGLKNLMDMGGLVVASLLAGRLLDPQARHPALAVGAIAAVLAVAAAVTLLGTREEPSQQAGAAAGSAGQSVRVALSDLFRIDFRQHTDYWWLIVTRFAYLLGIYGIQSFAQYYLRDVLQVPNPARQTGDLLAAITLALLAFTVAGGWLTDRFGAKLIMAASSVLGAAGALLLLAARTPTMLIVYGSVLGAGIGLFLTANWALANRLAPAADAGKFLGLTNLATAGAGALGRLEGPFIDLLNAARPGAFAGYTALFVFGAVCIAASGLLLLRVRGQRVALQPGG